MTPDQYLERLCELQGLLTGLCEVERELGLLRDRGRVEEGGCPATGRETTPSRMMVVSA